MINGKKVCVVMPAYNAEKTLQKTYDEIPKDIVDEIILTDDASKDKTVDVAKKSGSKPSSMTKIKAMGATKKPVIKKLLNLMPTL